MSQTVLTRENLMTIEPRRTPLRNAHSEMNSQQQNGRRSLSGKFRNLFRKSSPSPSRPTKQTAEQTHSSSTREQSPSPKANAASTEVPHLRAPVLSWPFGKKKSKSTGSTSEKVKKKETATAAGQMSTSAYHEIPQTAIRGQNFVPKTPELPHETAGRTQTSTSSYETTTKGYHGFIVFDSTKSTQQEAGVDTDAAIPPPYVYDRSRSPSLNHQYKSNTTVEYSNYGKTSTISDIELNPITKRTLSHDDHPSLSASQVLVENNPLILPAIRQYPSNASLNNKDVRSTTSSSIDVSAPKLDAPVIPFLGSTHKKEVKPTHFQSQQDENYKSLPTISNLVQSNPLAVTTYGSLQDTTNIERGNFNSKSPTNSHFDAYPGLSAIIAHHAGPESIPFNKPSSSITTSPKQTIRFDASTTTFNDHDDPKQWSNRTSTYSPISNHQHDGFIRPMTPPISTTTIMPDVSTIHIHVDDVRGQTTHSRSHETPKIYRSSTTIYTKEKFSYPNGGELRTWSIQDNNGNEHYQRPSTSIHIPPIYLSNEYLRNNGQDHIYEPELQHSSHYSDPTWNSNWSRSERDTIYDQMTRSHQLTDYTQGNNIANF